MTFSTLRNHEYGNLMNFVFVNFNFLHGTLKPDSAQHWDMDLKERLFRQELLAGKDAILEDFVYNFQLSDQELIRNFEADNQHFDPKAPNFGTKSEWWILEEKDGALGFKFREADFLRDILYGRKIGQLWFLLCDLDSEYGTNHKDHFPKIFHRNLDEIKDRRETLTMRSRL